MDLESVMDQIQLPRYTLQRQVALVTGAGRGIGRQAACALAWLGANVVIAEQNLVSGSETSAWQRRCKLVNLLRMTCQPGWRS